MHGHVVGGHGLCKMILQGTELEVGNHGKGKVEGKRKHGKMVSGSRGAWMSTVVREITCQFGAFLFGARQFGACQFGAFLFGARQFGACQFGAFHFDAIPVRRVSLWRDASLARFTLARFPCLCLR